MTFTEPIVEEDALTWFGEMDYAVEHAQQPAPGQQ
jgi:hypothetical protein